jgi:hypothetical protein
MSHNLPEAFELYAGIYLNGLGVEKNPEVAFKNYEICAKSGFGPCQFNLGILYKNGEGTPVNNKEAYRWLYKAFLNPTHLGNMIYEAAKYRNQVLPMLTDSERQEVIDSLSADFLNFQIAQEDIEKLPS